MPDPIIPIHKLTYDGAQGIAVDRIVPTDEPRHNEVHRHDFNELFFFAEGEGDHMIDLVPYKIEPPCMHLVFPGQVHQLERSRDSSGVVVLFPPDVDLPAAQGALKELFAPGDPPTLALSTAQLAVAFKLVQQLEEELQEPGNIAQQFLGILLLKCQAWKRLHLPPSASDQLSDVVDQFLQMIEDRYKNDRTVGNYAAALNISAGHLNERCKRRLGKTASMLLQDRMMLEAKRLLLHAPISIKEVAYALQMEDPAYFTRMFKRKTGMTPQAFRDHIREKYQ